MDGTTDNEVQYAIDQNNIGVHCFRTMGNYNTALHHFRLALAAKLSVESRVGTTPLASCPSNNNDGARQRDQDATNSQEQPFHNINNEQDNRCITPDPTGLSDNAVNEHFELTACGTREFTPYLYLKPFSIDECDTTKPTNHETGLTPGSPLTTSITSVNNDVSLESTRMCAKIIFNVGLTYQAMDRKSRKACSIYQIARSLLSAIPRPCFDSQTLLLHVATLNNFGVWCYDNEEYDAMTMCFEDLITLIDETFCDDHDDDDPIDSHVTLHTSVKRGIFHNLRACLDT